MQSSEVTTALDRLRTFYPSEFWGDGRWKDLIESWTPVLKIYPAEVLVAAFNKITGKYPDKFPTLGQVQALLMDEYKSSQRARSVQLRQKALPAPPASPEQALHNFYSQCDKALSRNLGDRVDDSNHHVIAGVLATLGPVFDIPATVMSGECEDSRGDTWDTAGAMARVLGKLEHSPRSVIYGLRSVPAQYKRLPTIGLLDEIIKNDRPVLGATDYMKDEL